MYKNQFQKSSKIVRILEAWTSRHLRGGRLQRPRRQHGRGEDSREECLANFRRVSDNLLDGVLRPTCCVRYRPIEPRPYFSESCAVEDCGGAINNSASINRRVLFPDRRGDWSLDPVRVRHPQGSTPTASEALAGAGETSRCLWSKEQLTLNPNCQDAPKRSEEHPPTKSNDYAPGKRTGAHQDAWSSQTN